MPRTPADYIENAALLALAGTGAYLHERNSEATLDLNYSAVPVILLGEYSLNQKTTTDRVVRANISVFFGDKKEGQGDDPEAEHAALIAMGKLKQRFLAALDSNPTVEITGIVSTPMHSVSEAMLTGLGIQFTLGLPAGSLEIDCLPEPLPASVVPGYSNEALLLALVANGTAVLGREASSAYSADYQ